MFCPQCRDEFRPGFTRCEGCGVALVDDLAETDREQAPVPKAVAAPKPMIDYCGFLSLEEAYRARDTLRRAEIDREIVIRDVPHEPGTEEFWIRVDAREVKRAAALLDSAPDAAAQEPAQDEGFACGECGHEVSSAESSCPGCGARFDEG